MSAAAIHDLAIEWVTIDAPSTRDVDDAISLARAGDGFRVSVAIADPTASVAPDSEVDREARRRAASVYSRDRVVERMLPKAISEGSHSLSEGEDRPALVFRMSLGHDLSVTDFTVSRATIAVGRRLSYAEVGGLLSVPDDPSCAMLAMAGSLSRALLRRRRARGALALFDLARLLYTDEDGMIRHTASAEEVTAHVIVQEFMVLANTQLARLAVEQDLPLLFRNHDAKLSAPAASDLATTIETWIASGAVDEASAREQFALLLGRARYGARATGHYALAEACYTHGTSPLRRYADLINLRQVSAWLDGRSPSYGPGQLEEIAQELNASLESRKEARSAHYKAAVDRKVAGALERAAVGRLEDSDVARALKVALDGGALSPLLRDELLVRLDGDRASDRLVDVLLAYLCHRGSEEALARGLVRWAGRVRSRAVNMLMHAEQGGIVKSIAIASEGAATSFTGTVRVVTGDGATLTRAGHGARKKDAEQMACLEALTALLLGSAANEGAEPCGAGDAQAAPGFTGNPKGALLELCQARRWPPPAFEASGVGPPHAMRFKCRVELKAGGRVESAEADGAASKREAEALASAALLARLQRRTTEGSGPAADPRTNAGGANPIGALQELAQKHRWRAPDYTISQLSEAPPLFRATVRVDGPTAGDYSAEASTKQEAKRRAADRALGADS
jgi:ribonuclease R